MLRASPTDTRALPLSLTDALVYSFLNDSVGGLVTSASLGHIFLGVFHEVAAGFK